MDIENNIDLTPLNTFGLPATADRLVRIRTETDVQRIAERADLACLPKSVLGGGSNVILPPRVSALVLKVEIKGRRLARESDDAWVIEVGAGENWHDVVVWTLDMGWPGLENLALIPGTTGAAPIQNIGAYGVELKDRFEALDAVDMQTGRIVHMTGQDCAFGYRDSVFKREMAGRFVVSRVRLRLPRPWQPVIGYPDLKRRAQGLIGDALEPRQIFDWVCDVRRAKLPDPAEVGNAGSFFKNPVVDAAVWQVLNRDKPGMVAFPQADGRWKLSAAWMIESCGWKGRALGRVGVYEKQALVLVNRGGGTRDEVLALSLAICESVQRRFGVSLQMEPIQF